MTTERLDLRLDSERRRKLEELAAKEAAPISETVRRLIDRAYEDALRERRKRAAAELAKMEVLDMPDPETLAEELAETYDPGIP